MNITGTVRNIHSAVELPPEPELSKALRVLNDQRLSIYQILYADGLAEPGTAGGQFAIDREVSGGAGMSLWLTITHRKSGISFKAKSPEKVLDNARLILNAVEMKATKCHYKACCPLATIRNCVCEVSFSCPIHGSNCHGSHD